MTVVWSTDAYAGIWLVVVPFCVPAVARALALAGRTTPSVLAYYVRAIVAVWLCLAAVIAAGVAGAAHSFSIRAVGPLVLGRDLFVGCLLGYVAYAGCRWVTERAGGTLPRRAARVMLEGMTSTAALTAGVFAAIGEELLWRVIVLAVLAALTHSALLAAVLTTLGFISYHGGRNLPSLVALGLFGFALAEGMLFTQDLLLILAAHLAFNLCSHRDMGLALARLRGDLASIPIP